MTATGRRVWWHFGHSRTETPHVLAINVAQSTYEVERRQVRGLGGSADPGAETPVTTGAAALGSRARGAGSAGFGGAVSHGAVSAPGFEVLASCSSETGAFEAYGVRSVCEHDGSCVALWLAGTTSVRHLELGASTPW
jgi:hypothetical protein